MLVKIDPTQGNSTTTLYAYNFMRAIDAVITAAAGSTPSVYPLTAANTFDTSKNLITSVISNTEAGGWTRSSSYNLVDASYASTGITNATYIADYYNSSGKSTYPYRKITFRPQTYTTWTTYPFLEMIYGIHTATDYSGTAGYAYTGVSATTTSWNVGECGRNTGYYSWLYSNPLDTSKWTGNTSTTAVVNTSEFLVAATADYVIIMNGYWSILYAGTRTTQNWENSYNNNPPVVAWCTPAQVQNNIYRDTNTKFMWALSQDGNGTARSTPHKAYKYIIANSGSNENQYTSYASETVLHAAGNVGTNSLVPVGDITGGPLFRSCMTSTNIAGTPGYRQPPVADSSGTLVPPAVPIWMMFAHQSTIPSYTYYNAGGSCLGIYKSLGGSDTYMNNYYTGTSQTFTINGESYIPFISGTDTNYRDMWLVRKA